MCTDEQNRSKVKSVARNGAVEGPLNKKPSRRQFLKGTAGACFGLVGLPYVVRSTVFGKTAPTPSDRIVIGCIGMGIRGTGNMQAFLQHEDVHVAAVCDVSRSQRQKAKAIVDAHYGDDSCSAYNDFRELCARKDIDACSIAPPDNWHVLMSLEAVRNGKDTYTEKALGLSVAEDKALRQAVVDYGAVFQFGTHQRSDENFRFGCELVRNGRIGKLQTIVVSTPEGMSVPNQPTEPVPDDLDYDLWLGPAPWAPYSYERCRPWTDYGHWSKDYSKWYHISDYCLGPIGGYWGVHHVDIGQWGNGTDSTGPVEISGTGVFPDDGLADCATNWKIELEYANGVRMIYMDNTTCAREKLGIPGCGQGVHFVGTEGWVFVSRGYGQPMIDASPKSLLTSGTSPNGIQLKKSIGGHHRNFVDCVKTRNETVSPIGVAVRSDTICHLSNIAVRLGRKLCWDPENETFVGDAEASRMLTRPMRSPWRL